MKRLTKHGFLAAALVMGSSAFLLLGLAVISSGDPGDVGAPRLLGAHLLDDIIVLLFIALLSFGAVVFVAALVAAVVGRRRARQGGGIDYAQIVALVLLSLLMVVVRGRVRPQPQLEKTLPPEVAIEDQAAPGDVKALPRVEPSERGPEGWGPRELGIASIFAITLGAGFAVWMLWPVRDAASSDETKGSALDDAERRASVELVNLSIAAIGGEPDPRQAIILCYQGLEMALSSRDFPKPASFTPVEYLEHILRRFAVPREPLWILTELFEKARFSDHQIDEADRVSAIGAFERIRNHLNGS